jgi:hypothetical protein
VAKMDEHNLWRVFLRVPDQNLIGMMAEIPFKTINEFKELIRFMSKAAWEQNLK